MNDSAALRARCAVVWSRLNTTDGEWVTPWLVETFADGTPFDDGDPVFSAYQPAGRKALKVKLDEHGEPHLKAWVDDFGGDEPPALWFLTIVATSQGELVPGFARLLAAWLAHAGSPADFDVEPFL